MPSNLFWPCDENRKTRTSCGNWNEQGKTVWKDIGWTNKGVQSGKSDEKHKINSYREEIRDTKAQIFLSGEKTI